MHSTDIAYFNDGYGYKPDVFENFTIHHNGDYSGDVKIVLESDRCEEAIHHPEGKSLMVVDIPFQVIKEFVGYYMAHEIVVRAEQLEGSKLIDKLIDKET